MIKSIEIQQNVPLRDKNWFQTGGPARYYCEPINAQEFQEALRFSQEHNLPVFVLGEGANICVSDAGFNGLVIRPSRSNKITFTDSPNPGKVFVTCPAGMTMDDLIQKTLAQNITGLEVFSGIPGTLGGSAYINLHYFTHFLGDFVVSATIIEKATGAILNVTKEWFNYGYNQSTLIAGNHYLIDITLELTQATSEEAAYAQGRRYEIIRHRHSRYPHSHTCGSFFRNFREDEVTLVSNGKKMIFVAFYLDKIGVKGVQQVGGAKVSWQHANMLVTTETATSADIIDLARTLQKKVYDHFGIIPQPECIFIGFEDYPLLRKV